VVVGPDITSSDDLRAVRRARRTPSVTQPDYLHVKTLVDGLREALDGLDIPVHDVLDVWCGSRPYDDLLPASVRCVGLDVPGNPYGVADVVSPDLLPFPDRSFDLVLCVQAFQYMSDPQHAVRELARVLRPGGAAVVSLVFGYEYDRGSAFEGRYTEHQLRSLFHDWSDVLVTENGGRTVAWGVLTGSLLFGLEQRAPRRIRALAHPLFAGAYTVVNGAAAMLARAERDAGRGAALPMNLTLTARRPR
jgi:SAM-dependent methyltransferase